MYAGCSVQQSTDNAASTSFSQLSGMSLPQEKLRSRIWQLTCVPKARTWVQDVPSKVQTLTVKLNKLPGKAGSCVGMLTFQQDEIASTSAAH